MTAHFAATIQGATLLALSSVMRFSDLPDGLETAAAMPVVTGSVLFVCESATTLTWR